VVRRRPEYVREGQAAEVLLKGIRGSPNLFLIGSILVVALVLILLSGAAIFTLALGPTETPIPTRTRVAIAVRTPTPTLTDTPTPTITETSTPLPTRTVFLPIPTRRSPVPAAVSPTVPPTRSSTLPPIEWDSRLGPGGIPGLASIRIIPANVGRGQKFWRVTKVTAEENEGGITGDHALYISVVDELGNRANGKKLRITGEYTKSSEFLEEKSPYDVCRCNFNYQVYGDNMSVIIEGDQYPSEAVAGIHQLEPNRWFKFFVTFKLSSNP
jgi:hypothetical protein